MEIMEGNKIKINDMGTSYNLGRNCCKPVTLIATPDKIEWKAKLKKFLESKKKYKNLEWWKNSKPKK